MAKRNCKKANRVGKVKELDQKAQEIMEKSDMFGQSIIGMMALFAYDWKGIGVAAVGLAKALAALKAVARETGVDIKNLYEGQLAHFEKQYNSLSDIDLIDTDKN